MEKKQTSSGIKRLIIQLFILFHLYIIAAWGLPGSAFRARLTRWIEPYVLWTGLWHSWDMFSPDPLSLNFNVVAEISYQDGTLKYWEFPRMEKLGYWDRFQKERFRKWRERVRLDAYGVVWPATCAWIARQNNKGTNKPVFVSLTRHWGQIPPPVRGKDYQEIPKSYHLPNNYTFHVHQVKQEELK